MSLPANRGGAMLLGPRFFTNDGTPYTRLGVFYGTCEKETFKLEPGREGVVGYPENVALFGDRGASADVRGPTLQFGKLTVSILANGVPKTFTIMRSESFFGAAMLRLNFPCSPIFERDGRRYCNDRSEAEGVVELAGESIAQVWPGRVVDSEGTLYRVYGPAVEVFSGPHRGLKATFDDSDVISVAGTPEILFVLTATKLRVLNVLSGQVSGLLLLEQGLEPILLRTRGNRVLLHSALFSPLRREIRQYQSALSGISEVEAPRTLSLFSGVNSKGVVWQCPDDDSVVFSDLLARSEDRILQDRPGVSVGSEDNSTLIAGNLGSRAAFCPVWDADGTVRFVGVSGLGALEDEKVSQCYENLVVLRGRSFTVAVDLRQFL